MRSPSASRFLPWSVPRITATRATEAKSTTRHARGRNLRRAPAEIRNLRIALCSGTSKSCRTTAHGWLDDRGIAVRCTRASFGLGSTPPPNERARIVSGPFFLSEIPAPRGVLAGVMASSSRAPSLPVTCPRRCSDPGRLPVSGRRRCDFSGRRSRGLRWRRPSIPACCQPFPAPSSSPQLA